MTAGWPIRCMASPISRPTSSRAMIWVRKTTSEGPDPRETSAARAPGAKRTARPRKAADPEPQADAKPTGAAGQTKPLWNDPRR